MPTIGYFIQKHGYFNLKIAGKLPYDIELSIASRNDEPLLNSIMQKTLDTISEEEIRTIVGKWIKIKVQQEFDYYTLIYVILFFSTLILLIIYRNKNINKQKESFKQIIESSSDGVFILDLKGNLIECSNKACEMLGYTKEEMLKLNLSDWRYPKINNNVEEYLKQYDHQTKIIHSQHIRKDGTIYDAELSIRKIFVTNRDVIYASARDITEKKKLEQKIKDQKEEFETIFNYSQDGIAVLDLDSKFITFNDAYLNMTGYKREELMNYSCIDLSAPEDLERTKEALNIAQAQGFLKNFEKTCIVKDQRRLNVNLSLSLLPNKKQFLMVTKDITALKRIEDQSRLVSMGEMIGNIAHQWRQPLSVITTIASGISFKSKMNKSLLNDEQLQEAMDQIGQQAKYLSNTINHFTQFIKGDNTHTLISMQNTLKNTLSLMEASLKNHHITLNLRARR